MRNALKANPGGPTMAASRNHYRKSNPQDTTTMAKKSKFFRVAREGATTDGRKIERSWIEQIVKNFNPEKYGARVWLEHIRGILPDSPFKAYGDVTAAQAEEVEIDGKKKLALFAQIDATPELVAMNKARQKIYTSVEIDPNFAKSGECYLVGLAVTDSPASLGTEMLAFAAGAAINPLAARKQNPDNLFSAAQEVAIEIDEAAAVSLGDTLFAKVKGLLGLEKKDTDARFADQAQAIEAIATSQRDTLAAFAKIEKEMADQGAAVKLNAEAIKARADEFAALEQKLETTDGDKTKRPAATGGNGTVTTDC